MASPKEGHKIMSGGITMGTQENVQLVKEGYAAFSRGDIPGLLALMAEDVEWISPGPGLPLAGTYRGRDGVANFFQKLSAEADILDFQPREFVAEGDRVLVVGWERFKVKATNRTAEVDWVMSFTVRNGKVAIFREYTDTKVIASAYESAAQAAG
jgi:ketosteroid isomerase-like protein